MIETNTYNVLDYLKDHRDDLTLLIVMAARGDYDLLKEKLGESEGWNLLGLAKQYGEETKNYPPYDFPIALSPDGKFTKKSYRLAGLIISGQKNFFAISCGLPGVEDPKLKLSKEEKKKLDDFFLELTGQTLKPADGGTLNGPVASVQDLPVTKKSNQGPNL